MPTGLAVPVGVNSRGGAALVNGNENDAKIIKLALADVTNENAFQQGIGPGVDMIFDINDVTSRARIQSRVEAVFRRFEAQQRYKLVDETLSWSSEGGEMTMEFKYVSLEADEERLFRQQYSGAGDGSRRA